MIRFEFDWDQAKADGNWRKHNIAFEDAMGWVFLAILWPCRSSTKNVAKSKNDGLR